MAENQQDMEEFEFPDEVEEKKARGISSYKEQAYYFCSKACKKKFDEEPEKYTKKSK